jgi:hypothetical protein
VTNAERPHSVTDSDVAGSAPQGARLVWWWVAAVGIVVVVVVSSFWPGGDDELADALLTSADFGGEYDTALMTDAQLGQAGAPADLPEGIRPAECAELLRVQPRQQGDAPAAGVTATGGATTYVELVTQGVTEWDPGRLDEVVGKCRTTTFTQDGGGTVEFSPIATRIRDGFALEARVTSAEGVVTIGVGVSRVGEHVVVLTGVTEGDLDRDEFARLASVAGNRVSGRL